MSTSAHREFNKNLIELKQKKFFEVIYRICKIRKIDISSLNFSGCYGDEEDQLAHYHPELNKICVSGPQFHKLGLDDVPSVASHEISHMFESGHDAHFHRENEISSIAGWRPPAGVVHVTSSPIRPKTKKTRVDKSRCNYALCREKRKLFKCEHCKMFFCEEHETPRTPEDCGTFGNNHDVHPCGAYFDYLEAKKEERDKKYDGVLTKLTTKWETRPIFTDKLKTSDPDYVVLKVDTETSTEAASDVSRTKPSLWQRIKNFFEIV